MTITFPQHSFLAEKDTATSAIADLHPLRTSPKQAGTGRLAGLAVTIVIHIGVILALALGLQSVLMVPQPTVIQAAIIPRENKVDTVVEPPVQQVRPELPQIVEPLVTITTVTPPPITAVQAPPNITPAPAPTAPALSGDARNSYFATLLAQLNRYKRYPAAAKVARRQGVVMLHFVMNAAGQVLVAEIAKSSGVADLDVEAVALVRRAQPLPPIPAGFGRDSIDAVVPIEFFLR